MAGLIHFGRMEAAETPCGRAFVPTINHAPSVTCKPCRQWLEIRGLLPPSNVAPPVATGPWKPCCADFQEIHLKGYFDWKRGQWWRIWFSPENIKPMRCCPFCGAPLRAKADRGEDREVRG